MTSFNFLRENFSADVRLELNVGDRSYPVSRTGPGYAFLREPATIPSGRAVLLMTIDGRKVLWIISLKYETAPIDGLIEFQIESGPHPEGSIQLLPETRRLLPFGEQDYSQLSPSPENESGWEGPQSGLRSQQLFRFFD